MRQAQIHDLLHLINALVQVRKNIARVTHTSSPFAAIVVLAMLARCVDVRVGQLAEALQVDISVASRQLAQLEVLGYVGRRPDPEDRRAHLVYITETGRRELEAVRASVTDHFARALSAWSDEELGALVGQLDRLVADLDEAWPTHHPAHPDRTMQRTGVKTLS